MEDASTVDVEPRHSEGDTMLLEANTKERGYVHLHFLFFSFFFSLHAFVSLLGAKELSVRRFTHVFSLFVRYKVIFILL